MGGWCLGWSAIVYMSSGMFRGKESSNRIKLSRLVQDLLNFGVSGSLQLWGGGEWLGGAPHTHAPALACMHVHACTHTCGKHDNFMQMAAPIGGIPLNSLWCHMRMRVHACACMCMWVKCILSPPPTPIHPPPPPRGPQNQSKFNSTWTNRDISILFEDFKSVETPPPKGGCIIW